MIFKPIHPEIKEVTPANVLNVLKQNQKYDEGFGFLHIPKTGGSGIMDFMEDNQNYFLHFPTPLFHSWTLRLLKEYLPKMKIIFVLRDPLERVISGFQSRLRMGRPKYFVPWTAKESSAFSIYRSPSEFLRGLIDDSDFHFSATTHVLNSIIAIRWNYSHYFETLDFLNANLDSIHLTADLSNIDKLLERLVKQKVISPEKNIGRVDLSSYKQSHVSKIQSSNYLKEFTIEDQEKMRLRLKEEYIIYDALVSSTKYLK